MGRSSLIAVLLLASLLAVGCKSGSGGGNAGGGSGGGASHPPANPGNPNPPPPPPPFTVLDASLPDGAVDVAVDQQITVTFSDYVRESSVRYNSGDDNVKVYADGQAGDPELISITFEGPSMHIVPQRRSPRIDYDYGTWYTLEIQTSIMDVSEPARRLAAPFRLRFRTVFAQRPLPPPSFARLSFTYAPNVPITHFSVHYGPRSRFISPPVEDPNFPGYEQNENLITNPEPPNYVSSEETLYEAVVNFSYLPNTRYFFSVKACAGDTCSPYSGEAWKEY